MSEESISFRMRARQCHQLAEAATDARSRETLLQMAAALDEEADLIEASERASPDPAAGPAPCPDVDA